MPLEKHRRVEPEELFIQSNLLFPRSEALAEIRRYFLEDIANQRGTRIPKMLIQIYKYSS